MLPPPDLALRRWDLRGPLSDSGVEGSSFVRAASPDEPMSVVPGTLFEEVSLAELPPID